MQINFILLFIFISSILLFVCKKFKLLIDIKGERHKKFSSKEKNYLIGGILILIYLILFYFKQNQILHIFFFVFIFLIGLFSDLKILNDPKKRFILQATILYIFIHFLEIRILETRFIPLDHLLNNNYFNHVFVVFCLMILMNGSNFMDGLNTLLVTYNLFIFLILLINKGIKKAVTYSGIGTIDKIFGFFFGFFRAYVIVLCIFTTIDIIYNYKKWPIDLDQSIIFPYPHLLVYRLLQ